MNASKNTLAAVGIAVVVLAGAIWLGSRIRHQVTSDDTVEAEVQQQRDAERRVMAAPEQAAREDPPPVPQPGDELRSVQQVSIWGGVSQYNFERLPFVTRCEASPIPDGVYEIRNAYPWTLSNGNVGMCMDVRSQELGDDLTTIQKLNCRGNTFQQYRFGDRNAAGCYRIQALATGPNAPKYLQWEDQDPYAVEKQLKAGRDERPVGRQYWNVIMLERQATNRFMVRLMSQLNARCVDRADAGQGAWERRYFFSLECRDLIQQKWILTKLD